MHSLWQIYIRPRFDIQHKQLSTDRMTSIEATSEARLKRKEQGRLRKKQKIAQSGGVRPRQTHHVESDRRQRDRKLENADLGPGKQYHNKGSGANHQSKIKSKSTHRFGRVMESVPCRNQPRFSTLSIAIPGSILSNCQTRELRTLMVGQIARAATIYHVDEIVVFDDKLSNGQHNSGNPGWRRPRNDKRSRTPSDVKEPISVEDQNYRSSAETRARSDPHTFMARVLQYCECPQYLRRHFFPMHPDLQFAGLLAPIDAPHHVRAEDRSPYREAVVLESKNSKSMNGSLVNCGIRSRPVEIDRQLAPGIRCTVKLDPNDYGKTGPLRGTVVSPSAPREDDGTYWGYTTRLAASINEVFDGCPFDGGYDLKIGTSERGSKSVEDKNFSLPKSRHFLIVFGGVAGIEECVDADESLKLQGSESRKLFDLWLNTCPYQGSRTIRTEEAVLISLATLSTSIAKASYDQMQHSEGEDDAAEIEFSDESPSDESSGDENDESGSKESDSSDD